MRKWLEGCLATILVITLLVHPLMLTSQASLCEGFIDLYSSYPSCFGGQGWGRNASVVWPQKEFCFNAEVSYCGWPEQYKDVAFQLIDPRGETWGIWVNRTDENGFTSVCVRMPWPCPTNDTDPWDYFGIWKVIATVDIACKVYKDTMYFKYDYLVNVWDIELDKQCYKHGEDITVTIHYGTYSMFYYDVVFAITALDSTGVPFGFAYDTVTIGKGKYGWCYYKNCTVQLTVHVEKWARTGCGSLTVAVLNAPLGSGGDPVCPEQSVSFQIRPADLHDVAVVDVSANKKTVTKGESVTLAIAVRNEGSSAENFNVTLHSNSSLLHSWQIDNLAPDTQTYLYFEWDTSGAVPGTYLINASISPLIGETEITDNSDSETITVEPATTTPIHDLALLNVDVSPRIAYAGGVIYITTTVKNKGSEVESFNVSASSNSSTLIQRIFVTSLPPSQSAFLTFTWNTTDLIPGTYNVSVYAYPVPLETELSDNWLSAGTVTVLAKPVEVVHDISVVNATASPVTVHVGEVVTIRAVVRNVGTETETFDLTAFYDGVPVLTQQVIQLHPLNERTLTFTWNTSGLSLGTYDITIFAYPVFGEVNAEDNILTGPSVEIVSDFDLLALLQWVIQELYWLLALLLALIALLILLLLYRRRKRRPANTKNQTSGRGHTPSTTSVKRQASSLRVKKPASSPVRVRKASSRNPRSSKRLSSKEFLKLAEAMWQTGPTVEYQSPNTWRTPTD
jgi:hypothetical protein